MPTPPHIDPFDFFDAWFAEASQVVEQDPNAMTLATVGADGRPTLRVVLLKHWDRRGFVFYTNRNSHKGRDLSAHPVAAVNFFWRTLGRQIRIEGAVETLPEDLSDAYFATRPRLSQVGAWASLQSEPLENRAVFDARVKEFEAKFEGGDVPRPPHWGGYRLVPDRMEFWRSGDYRWHDRWEFLVEDGEWSARRLYP